MSEYVSLRQAIGGMARINQFFVYELHPDPKRPGKYTKEPISRAGYAHGPCDPLHWLDMASAEQYLRERRVAAPAGVLYTLGFGLTKATGYWFIDVDSCVLTNGTWTEIGAWVYQLFPGAAFEFSSSLTGYHLFGRGVALPHRCKDVPRGLEFYTDERGIAFGLSDQAMGNADTDHTHALNTVWIPQVMPYTPLDEGAWDGKPRDDWRGPTDDEELIRRALASESAGAIFGNRASFADLWQGNETALRAAYPDLSQVDGIDRSAADMALAAHLAFWTGCDGARIERLMWLSALKREKWTEHRTYLRELTISNVLAAQKNVCQDRPVVEQVTPELEVIPHDISTTIYLSPEDQKEFFAGCVYIQDEHKIFSPRFGGSLLGVEQFNAMYGGRAFVLNANNEGSPSKKAFEAFTQSQSVTFPKAKATMFRPDLLPASVFHFNGVPYFNSYVPLDIEQRPGDISMFLSHIARLFPNPRDQQIIISYLAALVQYRGVKFRWCPVLQGGEGCGKGLIFEALRNIIGNRYTYAPAAKKLAAQFNDWIDERLLIIIDEIRIGRDDTDTLDTLKPMITENQIESEGKGAKKKEVRNYANFLMSTNWKDALAAARKSRRFAIFYSVFQDDDACEAKLLAAGMDAAYFTRMGEFVRDEHAAIAHYLMHYAIPAEFNPATDATRAPRTSVADQVADASRSWGEQLVLDAIDEGRPGFQKGWICSQRFDDLMKSQNSRLISGVAKAKIFRELGFIAHPGLMDGWTTNPVSADGNRRLRLFVKIDHSSIISMSPPEIIARYIDDQMLNFFGGAALTVVK